MPVKVRCACGAGISAPDAARGKTIRCKKCGEPVRVPRGKGAEGGEGKRPRKKKAAAPKLSIDDDDFFSNLDLEDGVHDEVRICPKCAQEVDEEDIECPHCGVNIETGILSAKQKKKRKRKGQDPDDYPKLVWKGSKEFLAKNKSLAFRLIGAFSFFSTIFFVSLFMAADYCIPEDPTNPETPIKVPVIVFWSFLTALSGSASMGCFWQLTTLIVAATMEGQDSLDRFNFDFFIGVALGFKLLLWPLAVMGIILVPLGAVVGGLVLSGAMEIGDSELQILGIAAGVIYLIPLWTLPVALSHMSAKFTYRAYIPYDVFRYAFASMKGVMTWWLVAFAVMSPALAVAIPAGIFAERLYAEFGNALLKLVELCGIATEVESRGFMFSLTAAGIGMAMIALSMAIMGALMAFSGVYLMRATGMFSFYNQRELGLGDKRLDNVPAGFWVRYLGLMIDILLCGIFQGIVVAMYLFGCAAATYLEMDGMISTFGMVAKLVCGLIPPVYFIFTESSPGRATMGMHALGLMVTDKEGNSPIQRGAAVTRFFGRLTIPISALTMSKDPELLAMHDKMSKTRVIWRKLVN